MAVPDAVLLLVMRRAHARIHVEHDASRRATAVHEVNRRGTGLELRAHVHVGHGRPGGNAMPTTTMPRISAEIPTISAKPREVNSGFTKFPRC